MTIFTSSQVPADPHIFRLTGAVSHPWLLPLCAAALHHGGVGTAIAAARAKLPQLVMPLAYDQPFWGQTLEDLGVVPWKTDELLRGITNRGRNCDFMVV